ncbi:MAG: DUF2179 domain-containing protein [Bacteroidia bacterium]|nr:DUF2179 domain-containing protein [Bacteroidia bacterium]
MVHLFNFNPDIFTWVVLPILIFLARICDVSIGTIRLILVSKGYKVIAPVLGFFEVIIWILAISQIMQHLNNVVCYIAYGGGFAMGNFVGIILEEKLSLGTVIFRIIPKDDSSELILWLKSQNYGVTLIDGEGSLGKVKVIFSILDRKNIDHVVSMINHFNPHSFYSIEDVRSVSEGIFRKNQTPRPFYANSFWNKKR